MPHKWGAGIRAVPAMPTYTCASIASTTIHPPTTFVGSPKRTACSTKIEAITVIISPSARARGKCLLGPLSLIERVSSTISLRSSAHVIKTSTYKHS
jgi:hypothetical protein